MKLRTLLYRACRLRCPRCGQSKLFRNHIQMHQRCGHCGLKYERAPGYFLGSIYINYGLTAILTCIVFFGLYFSEIVPRHTVIWIVTPFVIFFPLWFFRYARSFWVGFDQWFDPVPEGKESKESPS